MATMDYLLIGLLAVSAVVGLVRGLIREALSLVVWVGAAWCAAIFGDDVSPLLGRTLEDPTVRMWAGRTLVFVGVLFAGSIVVWLVGYLVRNSVITGTDRALGLLFGLARGVVVAGLLVLALDLVGFSAEPWWQQSKLVPYAAQIGARLKDLAEREIDGFGGSRGVQN